MPRGFAASEGGQGETLMIETVAHVAMPARGS